MTCWRRIPAYICSVEKWHPQMRIPYFQVLKTQTPSQIMFSFQKHLRVSQALIYRRGLQYILLFRRIFIAICRLWHGPGIWWQIAINLVKLPCILLPISMHFNIWLRMMCLKNTVRFCIRIIPKSFWYSTGKVYGNTAQLKLRRFAEIMRYCLMNTVV